MTNKEYFPINFDTVNDVKNTILKLETLYKNNKYEHRKVSHVSMIMYGRLKLLKDKKKKEFELAERYFEFLKERTKLSQIQRHKFKFKF